METLIIGRQSSSGGVDVAIPPGEDTVGRRHAELTVNSDGSFTIRDLGSANGTFVHNKGRWNRVASANLSPNQEIRLGDYVTTASSLFAMRGGGSSFEAGYQPAANLAQQARHNPLPVYQAATYDPHAAGPYPSYSGNQAVNEPLAIWSFILSLLGLLFCGLTSIPSVICGHVALSKIGNPARKGGRGLAIAGLAIGYVGVVYFLAWLLWIVFWGGLAMLLGMVGLAAMGA